MQLLIVDGDFFSMMPYVNVGAVGKCALLRCSSFARSQVPIKITKIKYFIIYGKYSNDNYKFVFIFHALAIIYNVFIIRYLVRVLYVI